MVWRAAAGNSNNFGKTPSRQCQCILQQRPVEAGAWVQFAARRNMLVPCNVRDGVGLKKRGAKPGQCFVLGCLKEASFKPFQFNADRVVIAIAAPAVAGFPCVPCPVIATHKLPQRASAGNKEMRRNLQAANALEVGMRLPVELIGKEALDIAVAKLAGRQADGVDDDQVDQRAFRARAEVG